jgi:predicted N-acyltransferase
MVDVSGHGTGITSPAESIQPGRDESPFIEIVASISEVDPAVWAQLAGENILANYGLLRLVEETRVSPHPSRYFLARDSKGLAGAVICHLEDSKNADGAVLLGAHRLDRMLFGKLADAARHLHMVSFPCLMCGTQISTAEPILIRKSADIPESKRIARALVEAIEATARREGWAVCFRQVKRESSVVAEVLTERGYLRGSEFPTACLELGAEWKSFADYRKHLKESHPSTSDTISKEVKRGKKAGLVMEQLDKPEEVSASLHRLLEEHNVRHNQKPFAVRKEFFDRLKANMGEKAVIYTAKIGEQLVGVQVKFQSGEDVIAWMIGIDQEAARTAATYFNLSYNRLIEDAIAEGYRRIYYGPLLWEVKARRGCKAAEADFYLRARNGLQKAILRPLLDMRSKRNDAISAELRQH